MSLITWLMLLLGFANIGFGVYGLVTPESYGIIPCLGQVAMGLVLVVLVIQRLRREPW